MQYDSSQAMSQNRRDFIKVDKIYEDGLEPEYMQINRAFESRNETENVETKDIKSLGDDTVLKLTTSVNYSWSYEGFVFMSDSLNQLIARAGFFGKRDLPTKMMQVFAVDALFDEEKAGYVAREFDCLMTPSSPTANAGESLSNKFSLNMAGSMRYGYAVVDERYQDREVLMFLQDDSVVEKFGSFNIKETGSKPEPNQVATLPIGESKINIQPKKRMEI